VRVVQKKMVDIPADGVANDVIGIDFPSDLTQVHFIRLVLSDAKGKPVSESFYWRSKDKYEKTGSLTGPGKDIRIDVNGDLVRGRRVELLAGAWNAKKNVVMTETIKK
jgi:hypothetical protein